MDIRGAGAGGASPGLSGILRPAAAAQGQQSPAAGPAQTGRDAVAGLLLELSASQAAWLLDFLEPGLSPQAAAQVDELLRGALAAAGKGEAHGALEKIERLVSLEARRAEGLASQPGLAPIRNQVGALLARLAAAARADAERLLGEANQRLEAPGGLRVAAGDLAPATLLLVAARLFDAGGYANWIHSARILRLLLGRQAPEAALEGETEAAPARLTAEARREALSLIQQAARSLQAPGAAGRPVENLRASTLLLAAARLLEAGGAANWLLSEEASRVLLAQAPPSLPGSAPADGLLRAAVSAAAGGDVSGALEKLAALVALDPRRAETLASEPALAAIRREVAALVARLTAAARVDAVERLRQATQALPAVEAAGLPLAELAPATLLRLAARLIEAGGYANWVHSAELSRAVLAQRDQAAPPPAQLERLLRSAVSAAGEGDLESALAQLATLAALDPTRAGLLASEPALAPIRARVEALLAQLNTAARQEAETQLQQATHWLRTAGQAERPIGNVKPSALLLLAGQLFEAGGYANWRRSAEVSQLVLDQRSGSASDGARLDRLLQAAVAAASQGDVDAALEQVATLIRLAPRRAEDLASEPALAPIRKEVESLLARLSASARMEAESKLREAGEWLRTPGVVEGPIRNLKPATLLAAAAQLIEAGGYANSVQSAAFSQMVLDQQVSIEPRPAEAVTSTPRQDAESRLGEATARLEAWGGIDPPVQNLNASRLLLMAAQLAQAGGYAAWIQSAELSRMVIEQQRRSRARGRVPGRSSKLRREVLWARMRRLWRRAPLLVLLVGWLAAGVSGGTLIALFRDHGPASAAAVYFRIWALGFLALVGFGFYMRVRKP